ncbi:MAG: hypothetical protein HDQ91_04195 [Desulfovibrio sp.]|nr:hypothetical protein [Desulfovibrio sp.]
MDFEQLLRSARPGDALLEWTKPLPVFLDTANAISAGPRPWHSGSVLGHLARCMNETAGDPLAVWMALTHDAGKLTTPKCLLPHHYGHELRGAILAPIWARQLGLGPAYAEAGRLAARWHMRAGKYAVLRQGKKRQLLETFPPDGAGASFWKMVDADCRAPVSRLALTDARRLPA